ncbi:MAG: TetR/AcrR family transcriptional regulator [Alphaproteobacteria bacterium]|nr:TetR/AcrR family transcriptional regulator [Alphaproteobacteria bacterium]MDX5417214.1 TetR/AcrR family transcriptional regulator [Alphaproteobacteria bacterium]MDX5494653.1 TetR/AcrR family transcriptional regulator [Alphaproteobacteria bacterium]
MSRSSGPRIKREAKPKDSYHHGNLREALVTAALALLDEDGIEAVTIRAVARRAGVTHAAPANHFRDRRALLTALAAEIFAGLRTDIDRKLGGAGPELEARLRVFAQAMLRFGLAAPNRYRLIWRWDALDGKDPALATAMDGIYDRLIGELSAGARADFDPHTRAIALWSMVHGYVSMRIEGNLLAGRDKLSGEPREVAIVSAILRGLGA